VIISDASEYRGVLLYQTANRFSNFSPEGRQRPMNVPSRVRVTSRFKFGASRAMAAAPRLGWAPGDFPPLLPTQADGRRAHMHPARGTGIIMMCQPSASAVASGRPLACGSRHKGVARLPRADAPTGRSRPASTRGRSAVTGTQQCVCQCCVQTRSPTRSRALNGQDPKPQGGCRPTYSSAHLCTFSLHPIPIPIPSPVQRVPLAQCASP
jgi:hypothetical protein